MPRVNKNNTVIIIIYGSQHLLNSHYVSSMTPSTLYVLDHRKGTGCWQERGILHFESLLHCLLPGWPLANYWSFLPLSFLVCKMGKSSTHLTETLWGANELITVKLLAHAWPLVKAIKLLIMVMTPPDTPELGTAAIPILQRNKGMDKLCNFLIGARLLRGRDRMCTGAVHFQKWP